MLDRYPQFWSDAFDFQGRIRRIDYWTIVLLNLVIASLLSLMSGSLAWVFGVALIVPFFQCRFAAFAIREGPGPGSSSAWCP